MQTQICKFNVRDTVKQRQKGEKNGIVAFTLEVRESNHAAIALYEKFNFINAGVRKNYYEKPTENAVIMWKNQER